MGKSGEASSIRRKLMTLVWTYFVWCNYWIPKWQYLATIGLHKFESEVRRLKITNTGGSWSHQRGYYHLGRTCSMRSTRTLDLCPSFPLNKPRCPHWMFGLGMECSMNFRAWRSNDLRSSVKGWNTKRLRCMYVYLLCCSVMSNSLQPHGL